MLTSNGVILKQQQSSARLASALHQVIGLHSLGVRQQSPVSKASTGSASRQVVL
jgi:hypothetical protein